MLADLSLILEITFVRHDDNWEMILVLDTEDLLVERAYLLEGATRRDGIDEQETFSSTHVLFAHRTIHPHIRRMQNNGPLTGTSGRTRILPGQQYPVRPEARPLHQSRIAFGMSLIGKNV